MLAMAGWTDAKVLKLIELWKEDGIQEQLEGSRRNKHIYAKLASELTKAGYNKAGEQAHCKVKKLRQEYKKLKDNNGLTGRGRGKWRFFDAMDEILGNHPATCPPVVLDTTEDVDPLDDTLPVSDGEKDDSDTEESSEIRTSSSPQSLVPESNSSNTELPTDSTHESKQCRRKRKRSKVESFEEVMSKVMKTVTDGLKETDKMFLELEEKRMESEIQQRGEEHQF